VSVGGLAGPALGSLADATSLQTALTPLVLMPVLSRLLFATLREPGGPRPRDAESGTGGCDGAVVAAVPRHR
jgi:MFS transporter, FSR family, fosmidomycin resistance protein